MSDPPAMASSRKTSVALPVSQEETADVFRALYANQYFTNHGPLAQQFEQELESLLHVNHAVSAGNDDLALLIALSSLDVRGSVIIPAFDSAQSLRVTRWLDLQPQLCDVDRQTFQPSVRSVEPITGDAEVVILSERLGHICPPATVRRFLDKGLKVVRLFGGTLPGSRPADAVLSENEVHVYSFGPDSLLTTLEGGAIVTDDDHLASRFRNTRSSYGMREPVQVTATCNGRFSEFQAGLGLKSLAKLTQYRGHIESIRAVYQETFSTSNKIRIAPNVTSASSCIPAILSFSATQLTQQLATHGIQLPTAPTAASSFPEATYLHNHLILLPISTTTQHAKNLAKTILQLSETISPLASRF